MPGWSVWTGAIGIITGSIDGADALWIGGAAVYIAGAIIYNNSSMKLQRAINLYNGIPSDLAWNKNIRDPSRHASGYGIGWKFEF